MMEDLNAKRQTILIVDDDGLSRELLNRLFSVDYDVEMAKSGREALEKLRAMPRVDLMLLDIFMSDMDGFEVMAEMQADEQLRKIPVVIFTAGDEETQIKCLELGALDVLHKPSNPQIAVRRVANFFARMESARAEAAEQAMRIKSVENELNEAETDGISGLLNKKAFLRRAAHILSKANPGEYLLQRWDIDNFKVFNDIFGIEAGNQYLKSIGSLYRNRDLSAHGIMLAARFSGDHFVCLYKAEGFDAARSVHMLLRNFQLLKSLHFEYTPRMGLYLIDDPTLDVSLICDRALLALKSIKGQYGKHFAWYEESMRTSLVREHEILSEMTGALRDEQFLVYYQPIYNHDTEQILSAEALVRWPHPSVGFIAPNDFIPLFEKNGFVFELDKFVWKQVCLFIRGRLDGGMRVVPISVNVSRYDIMHPAFFDALTGLVEQYKVPTNLLRLEITESAFAHNVDHMIATVKRLRDYGLIVEIDDFGSGYSTFNTLNDVHADVLKLDMQFLRGRTNARRSGNILESIVRMAKWLGMSVIAEGVEELAQADFLKSIGCNVIQGFLYARPMPRDNFEALLAQSDAGSEETPMETVSGMDRDLFWDPSSLDTLMFSGYVGAACVIEYHNGRFELIRVNDRYRDALRIDYPLDRLIGKNALYAIPKDERTEVEKNLLSCTNVGSETHGVLHAVFERGNSHEEFLRYSAKVIAKTNVHTLYYVLIENATEQILAERRALDVAAQNNSLNEQLLEMMDDIPGGFARMRIAPDGGVTPIFMNNKFCELVGMTLDEAYRLYASDAFAGVHPDDVDETRRVIGEAINQKKTQTLRIRFKRGSGGYVLTQAYYRITDDARGNRYLNGYYADLTEQATLEEKLGNTIANIPAGIGVYESRGKDGFFPRYLSDTTYAMYGFTREEHQRLGGNEKADYNNDMVDEIRSALNSVEEGTSITRRLSVRKKDGSLIPIRVLARRVHDSGKYPLVYTLQSDATEEIRRENEAAEHRARMETLMNSIPGGVASYVMRPEGLKLVFASDGVAAISGRTPEEYRRLIEENGDLGTYKPDTQMVQDGIKSALENGTEIDLVYRVLHVDGHLVWIHLRARRLGDLDGYPLLYAVYLNLSTSTELYQRIVDETDNVLFVADRHTKELLFTNKAAKRVTGRELQDLGEMKCSDLMGCGNPGESCTLAMLTDQPISREAVRFGRRFFVRMTPIDWNGHDAFIAFLEDRTELYESQDRLRQNEEELRFSMEQMGNMLCRYDVRTHVLTSQTKFAEMHHIPTECHGVPEDFENYAVFRTPRDKQAFADFFAAILSGETTGSAEIQFTGPNGKGQWEKFEFASIFDADGKPDHAVLSVEDITEEMLSEQDLRKQADMDSLTGIYNRGTAERLITKALQKHGGAFVLIDLDDLKGINDTLGHTQGDRAIKMFAEALNKHFRETDIVARLGGDEFIAFLPNFEDTTRISENLSRFISRVNGLFVGENNERNIQCSAGCAIAESDDTFDSLYMKADAALYHVKRGGKNDSTFYSSEMENGNCAHGHCPKDGKTP